MGAWVALGEFNGSKKPEYIYTVKRWDASAVPANRYDQAATTSGRWEDGQLGCSCPAFKFFYRGHPRTERIWCKHTRRVEANPRIFDEANELAAHATRRCARKVALFEHLIASGAVLADLNTLENVRRVLRGASAPRGSISGMIASRVSALLERLDLDAALFAPLSEPVVLPKPGRRGLRRITLPDE